MPASSSTARTSAARSACQSWLPSTATTGASSPPAASATIAACSGSPCVVRSPASRTRSARSASAPNASAARSRSFARSPKWMSPAAAIRIRHSSIAVATTRSGYAHTMDDEQPFSDLENALKRSAAALRGADVPFLLGGSLASWARGGPETRHDLDLVIKPADVDRDHEALEQAGFKREEPPEEGLVKAWEASTLVDLIHHPKGLPVDDALIERGQVMSVLGMGMRV